MANQLKAAMVNTILHLKNQGWSQRKIARELCIDRETIRDIHHHLPAYLLCQDGITNCGVTVKNNIIAYNQAKGLYGDSYNSYNCFWQNAGGSFYDYYAKTGDIYNDPGFVMIGSWSGDDWTAGDYHIMSEYGRYDAALETWVADAATSPCVDAGDPADGIMYEPNPNGGFINIGAYGGTEYASMGAMAGPDPNDPPPVEPVCVNPPQMDANNDCRVNILDLAVMVSEWLNCGYADSADCQ